MTIKLMMAMAGLVLTALPAGAQDVSTPYDTAVADYGRVQLDSTLGRRRLQQAQQHRRRGMVRSARVRGRPTPQQVLICRNLGGYRQRYGATNPKVVRLTGLCRAKGL